jgi:protein-disulfide isomerase
MLALVRSSLVTLAACAALAGCTTSEKVATPASGSQHARDCNGASLALSDDVVVGKLDGQPITYKDLGPEAMAAEKKALFEYCDAVHATRATALDNYVTEKLVEKAAKAAGQSPDDWMQAEVQKRIPQPSDAEIEAFYKARARPGAPPLEEVKGQVVMMMQREKSEDAVRDILEGIKKGVSVEKTLPDVRSPPRDVAVTEHTARKGGSERAKVRVVEFADFQCPYCSMAANTVKELTAKYGDKVEFAYRNFPLRSIHPNAQRAAEFAQCSQAQGKFWEMHDKLYAAQDKLDEESMRASAKEIGLDEGKLDECLQSGKGAADVDADYKTGESLGVEGTPTFFVNGRQHVGAATVEALSATIDAELMN